ncbi:MAG: hypothetical protein C0623_11305 [Desulfuromonas sp.]|nr:MAG: hypothetical protein C0623_11305 [Desulfuromonas sp.]
MPLLVDSPTELTTAATDFALGLLAVAGWFGLYRLPHRNLARRLWLALLAALAASSFLGAAAHAIRMDKAVNDLLWQPLYFLLGLTLTLLALVAVAGWRGEPAAAGAVKWLLPLPFLVVAVTWLGSGSFIWFVLFEALIMIFCAGVYLSLVRRRHPGSGWVLAGIMISILAAVVQAAGPYSFKLIWLFDHNGLFHIVQLPGVVCFVVGAHKNLTANL